MLNQKFTHNPPELPPDGIRKKEELSEESEEPVLGSHKNIENEFKLKLFLLRNRKYLWLIVLGVVLLIIALGLLLNARAIRDYFDQSLKNDSDADGVVDKFDRCPGFDDRIDENKNNTADGCDEKPPADFKIDVVSTNIFPKQGSADVLVELRNASSEWGLKELGYTIKLLDASDTQVAIKTGTTYILPLETPTVVELGIATESIPTKAIFEMTSQKFVKTEGFEPLNLSAKDIKTVLPKNSTEKFLAVGSVLNQTSYSFEQTEIVLTAADGSNNFLGTTRTVLNGFDTKTQRDFRVIWNLDNYAAAAKVNARIRVNIYQSDNFINIFRAQGGKYLEYGVD